MVPNDLEYSVLSTEEIIAEDDNLLEPEEVAPVPYNGDPQPTDKFYCVHLAFGLLGLATLLPWNIFITATDYWMFKFRDINATHIDVPHENKTELQTFFDSYLSIASNVPFLFILFLNALWGHKVPEDVRTVFSLFSVIVVFIVTTCFIEMDTDSWQNPFFGVTLGTVVILSIFSAVLQGSITGNVSVFPSDCMHSMITGQSLAGIFAAVAQIISLAGHFRPTISALYYFISADFVLILTLIVYIAMQRSDYYNFYIKRGVSTQRLNISVTDESKGVGESFSVFPAVKFHALSAMMILWVTIAVFPPIVVLIVPVNPELSPWTGRFFIPVCCFLLFNVSDFAGRTVSGWIPLPSRRPGTLFALTMSRWLLVPLLMLCNAHPRSHLPVLFESEAYFIAFGTIIGFSNGYLFSNAMIHGPKFVSSELRQNVGFILVFFLGIGVAFGSLTSNLILRLL